MLNTLIVIAFIMWIAGFFVNGFNLYNCLLLIPTIMFMLRKFGLHIKMTNMLACEILFLFFSIAWKLIFHKFVLSKVIIGVILRVIFILIIVYDDTAYVYVQEERKKK